MEPQHKTPAQIVGYMLEKDRFSQWMNLQIDTIGEGHCRLHYAVNEQMVNGFDIVHGGILFAAADSAFAFACNSHGVLTVALDVSISFTRPARRGDTLFVEAREIYLGERTGVYDVRTTNSDGELVALFKGTAYRTSRTIG